MQETPYLVPPGTLIAHLFPFTPDQGYLTNLSGPGMTKIMIGLRIDGVYDVTGFIGIAPGIRFPYGYNVENDHP